MATFRNLFLGYCPKFSSSSHLSESDSSASFDIVALNPFRFSSEYYDSELDLVYYNYRHYSPALGRFLSRDPIQEQGGLNLYAFAGNNHIQGKEILGWWAWPWEDIEDYIEIVRVNNRLRIYGDICRSKYNSSSVDLKICSF